jgi:hypothetical protein
MHPFTLVSTNPPELVSTARDAFTRDLRDKAMLQPESMLRASLDGPYDSVTNWTTYDRVLLVAGGIGAGFCIGVALGMVREMEKGFRIRRPQRITLVWVIKDRGTNSTPSPVLVYQMT